ncbi:hypothetical protein INT43_000862 [Umbelopsis isabellina]|uniref:Uncharacterized protein n=1 Tax=Mortierella isabellina TaxID=91625 RepID=A0A8H7Q1Z5_MORIS|nr:hypothetical protein INT43_000862 [Umbelopsis isabellina]
MTTYKVNDVCLCMLAFRGDLIVNGRLGYSSVCHEKSNLQWLDISLLIETRSEQDQRSIQPMNSGLDLTPQNPYRPLRGG